MSAVRGRDGRTSPPPPGGVYVRDPQAARAEAIRARVALHKRRGEPVPTHLQYLFDQLPAGEDHDVDLVNEKTGEPEGEVTLVDSLPKPEPEPTPEPELPEPEPEPEPELKIDLKAVTADLVPPTQVSGSTHSGSGELGGAVAAVARPVIPETPAPPAVPAKPEKPEAVAAPATPRKGRPRKAVS